jgi:hypothetical protein
MWRKITAYSLFILGFLTITFFRHYTGEIIPYPSLFWLIGFALFFVGYMLIRYTPSVKDQKRIQQLRQLIGDLKANGEKIRVDLSDCEILEHNYSEHRETYGRDSNFLSLTGAPGIHYLLNELEDETHGTGIANVTQSVLIFHYPNERTGQTEKFVSPVISKDRVSLSFYLDKQQQTTLYVDKTDRSRYYFDLAFLRAQ